eukprot:scaffold290177_cov40-Tisochrysis_lutea.AAC.1
MRATACARGVSAPRGARSAACSSTGSVSSDILYTCPAVDSRSSPEGSVKYTLPLSTRSSVPRPNTS